jgi:hypothetical protein
MRTHVMLAAMAAATLSGLGLAGAAGSAGQAVRLGEGSQALHGSLLVPPQPRAGAAVLMLAGSGPTDRDGNQPAHGLMAGYLRQLAEALAAQGIASLRIDKRGVGDSVAAIGAEAELRFATHVADAVAWARFLAAQPQVRCVVLLGHSEGALVAMLAAQRMAACGVVVVGAPGAPLADIIERQMQGQGVARPVIDQSRDIMTRLRAGQRVADVPAELHALFRPSVQPYLISMLGLDPAAEIAKLAMPVLILQGDADLQVSAQDAARLAAARPGATLVVLPGVNHVLKQAPSDRNGNLATYADPALPLAPGVAQAVADFARRLGP